MRKTPKHGYCCACLGPIPEGEEVWTLTRNMQRVHANQDDCVDFQKKTYNKTKPVWFRKGMEKINRRT